VFGGLCSSLGAACLLLAACSGNEPRREPPLPAPPRANPETPATALPTLQVSPPESVAPESPWPRLRSTFALHDCDFNASVERWTRLYSRTPKELSSSFSEAMPYLLLVTDQLQKYRLPGEFAFLPYIESNYVPIATTGDRAAGIWQLMPDTAIEAGLHVTADFDGRLDIHASTVTAISLLQQYHEEFGDWRVSDMAFNAGLYKVRALVGGRQPGDWSPRELAHLRVNPGTHDHMAKLLALACIVSDPARYRVNLPEPRVNDALAVLDLPAPIDLHLAAYLTGLDMMRLRQLNPGLIRGHMPADGPFHLLIPAPRRLAFEQTLGKLPQYTWRNWHEVVLKQTETLDLFAMLVDIDPTALAAINGYAADAPLPPGTRLLLPGVDADTDIAVAVPAPAPADDAIAATPESLVVHSGDTLWDIARRYGLHVDDLLRWNGLTRSATLKLGQHLLLNAPDRARR